MLWLVDWRRSLALLGRVDLVLVGLILVLNVQRIALSAWKWQLLLRALAIRMGLFAAIRIYWIGTFASSFLPSTVGGDFLRTALARRYGGIGPIAASVVVERLTGFAVLLVAALAAVALRPDLIAYRPLWLLLMAGIAAGTLAMVVVCTLLVLRPRWLRRQLPRAADARPGSLQHRLLSVLSKLDAAFTDYVDRPRALAAAIAISILFYALVILNQYVVIRAVGLEVDPLAVAAIAPLIMLIAALPLSLNGIGISEGAFVFFYAQVGLTPEQALAAALLRRLAMTAMTLAGGLFWLVTPGRRKGAEEAAAAP